MNQIFQVAQSLRPIRNWVRPKQLVSSVSLPYAPQFWIELAELLVNWLVRICKMMEPMETQEVAYRRIVVDREKAGRAVIEHLNEFLRQQGDMPECVLMGRDIFTPLMGELDSILSFQTEMRWMTRYRTIEYYGVKIVCIPWMEGMIALPDLSEELRRAL